MFISAAARIDDIPRDSEAGRLFESIFGPTIERRPDFHSISDVDAWVERAPQGELALRLALAVEMDPRSRKIAEVWLQHQEQSRADARSKDELRQATRAAKASEVSARWTMVAALAAAAGTVAAAVATWVTASAPPPVVQMQIPPAASCSAAASSGVPAPVITPPPGSR